MRVAVLGAGVAGVVAAYYLSRRGHTVTVFEQAREVAAGTSFANAAQLSYSFTDALARPAFVRHLPSLLLGRDPGIRIRTGGSTDFMRWGLAFLRQCTTQRARENTVAVLQLAQRSSVLMNDLMVDVPLDFAYRPAGKLVLLADRAELAAAREAAALKCRHGCVVEILTRPQALDLEPALSSMEDDFIAAAYSAGDAVADARAFTAGLAEWLTQSGAARIRLGEQVTSLVMTDGAVAGVRTGSGEDASDAVVVCLGCETGTLLRPLGLRVPICPVRGYSLTFPAGAAAPSVSITHPRHRIVYSRIGNTVRIAGFADFVDTNTSDDPARIDALLDVARRTAPLAADYDAPEQHRWGGFRPMTPDSRPLFGPARIPGLYFNTGHGMLGWTLACATGHAVAESLGESRDT